MRLMAGGLFSVSLLNSLSSSFNVPFIWKLNLKGRREKNPYGNYFNLIKGDDHFITHDASSSLHVGRANALW